MPIFSFEGCLFNIRGLQTYLLNATLLIKFTKLASGSQAIECFIPPGNRGIVRLGLVVYRAVMDKTP